MLSEASMYCTHNFAAIGGNNQLEDQDLSLVCRCDQAHPIGDEDNFEYTEGYYQDPYMDKAARLCKYRGWWTMELYYPTTEKLKFFENLTLNESDVILTGFPKSGTTWLQEIIYRIACYQSSSNTHGNEDQLKIMHRFPTLEGELSDFIERNKGRSPRLFKSHLPYSLLPKDAKAGKGKIIHIARNPKDVLVSYYHFSQYLLCMNYTGDFKHMFNSFMNGTVAFGPWLKHIEEYWHHRGDKNVLFITYEQLHRTSVVIQMITNFLGMSLSDNQLTELIKSTSFEAMKKDNSVNFSWLKEIGLAKNGGDFMRKGEVGDWRNYFSDEMNARMELECLLPLRNQNLTFEDQNDT